VRPAKRSAAFLWKKGDGVVIDGSVVTFLPLAGALLILFIKDEGEARAATSAGHAVHDGRSPSSCRCGSGPVRHAMPGFQFVEKTEWLGSASYQMGVDGISMLFVMLTTFLMPICILASWESIEKRVKEYMIAFLVLETLMIGVFCALDWCCSTSSSRPA
jgi:NADH-quinone oxidoreductase subunit M